MAKLYLGSNLISGGGGGVEVTVTPSAASVDEGATVTFTISTAPAQAVAQVLWRLTGVSAADVVGGLLAGVATTNGSGVATVAVEMVNDFASEGAESMTLSAGMVAGSGAVTINDTSSFAQAYFEAGMTSRYTYSNLNRTVTKNIDAVQASLVAGSAYSSGKKYIEFEMTSPGGTEPLVGVATASNSGDYLGNYTSSYGVQGSIFDASVMTGATRERRALSWGSSSPFIISIAADLDAKKIWVGLNGAYRDDGDPAAGTNPNLSGWTSTLSLYPAIRYYAIGGVATIPASVLYLPSGFTSWA
jgi:hypothetical protein